VATAAITSAQAVLTCEIGPEAARPHLWYVTRCGVRTDAADAAPSLPQSTVWGVVRTLHLEHPELSARCVDLPEAVAMAQIDALADEIRAASTEQQIALRHGARLVARVDRAAAVAPAFPAVYRVGPRARGTIESLEIVADSLPTPAADDIVIRVASGLNVTPRYPGPGRRRMRRRDGRCGVTTHARAIASRRHPQRWAPHVEEHCSRRRFRPRSLDTAAALPIAYLTAYHTLIERAGLQRGERVLIHAGAGGVGMAAIRLAQRAGAEVFATAGSDAKRAYLRELGVPHVLDSRSLSFADEVLARTGGEGVHVTLNSLADAFVERSLAVTARGGRFLEIGKRGIWTPTVQALGDPYHVAGRISPARIPRPSVRCCNRCCRMSRVEHSPRCRSRCSRCRAFVTPSGTWRRAGTPARS
jgi:hypothetical protein